MPLASVVDVDDTIVAIGSAPTPAVRGVVRLSGPSMRTIIEQLGIQPNHPRTAHRVDATIALPDPLGSIPAHALVWPTTRSYTGQPSAEIHTYGSLTILAAIVNAAIAAGARAARPGEFTLRAFLAGRLDLTQAEAVLGVIDAEGRGALDHALRQLSGNLSKPLQQLRSELLDLLADVEAGLDFVDEDIQFISDADLQSRLASIRDVVSITRAQLATRSRDKSEWMVALRGLPNAGKSRLINALAGRDVAIVAEVAGTTRDVVTVPIEIAGHSIVLIDTAGIEHTGNETPLEQISRQAQQHAERAGREADLRLWCVDHSQQGHRDVCEAMKTLAEQRRRRSALDLWVATQCDRCEATAPGDPWIATSAVSGQGLASLREQIVRAIDSMDRNESSSVAGTAARCSGSLQTAETALNAAIEMVRQEEGHEYVSAEIRIATAALGEVTGAVYTDDILDRVFSRFCIGK